MKTNIALVYIRNDQKTIFPVNDINHAVCLANAISDSDSLNKFVHFNIFEVCQYDSNFGTVGSLWKSKDGIGFEEYWRKQMD